MNIHCLQHAAGEGIGKIGDWIRERGHVLSESHLHLPGCALPEIDALDFLVIMGGGMNVYEYRNHPWLREEKRFIELAIAGGKSVLGICLGAQLIADVLGAKVYQNAEFEIGWFPVRFNKAAREHPLFKAFPHELTPMHWHGDTFDLPRDAVHLAESDGCRNQAFAAGEKVVGLQFHLEVRHEDVLAFLEDPSAQYSGRFVHNREQILAGEHHLRITHEALYSLLDAMAHGDNITSGSVAPRTKAFTES